MRRCLVRSAWLSALDQSRVVLSSHSRNHFVDLFIRRRNNISDITRLRRHVIRSALPVPVSDELRAVQLVGVGRVGRCTVRVRLRW